MGIGIRLAIVLLMVTSIIGGVSVRSFVPSVNKSNSQMMTISCEHCHENILVDISKVEVECEHCYGINEFRG